MKTILASAFLATSVLAAPALAQDKQPAEMQQNKMKSDTAMPAADGAGGMMMADTATAKVRFVTAKPAEVTATKLVGKNLYNKKDETVGQIEDLVIDKGKTVTGVVVSVGGFLGMGERYVLVDPSTIFLHGMDGGLKAMVDTDKDTLKNAPEFKYNKKNS